MNRTTATLIAIIAAAGLTTSVAAQARHDEQPHGYNAKVVAEQQAKTTQAVPFATGPRPHDAVRRVAKAQTVTQPPTVAATPQEKK